MVLNSRFNSPSTYDLPGKAGLWEEAAAMLPLDAQLSHPPSRSGWLADEVILGGLLVSLSVEREH